MDTYILHQISLHLATNKASPLPKDLGNGIVGLLWFNSQISQYRSGEMREKPRAVGTWVSKY